MSIDRVVIGDLAKDIGYELADRFPDGWTKPEANNAMRRDIAAAMNIHGWSLGGVPGILPFIREMTQRKVIFPLSSFNGLPPNNPDDVDLTWTLSHNDATKIKIWLLRNLNLQLQYAKQDYEKRIAGRYKLQEAAEMLEKNTGERSSVLLEKLIRAVREGRLHVYEPGKQAGWESETVRDFHDECYWEDLNKWLSENEPRIAWRFSDPARNLLDSDDSQSEASIDSTEQKSGRPGLSKKQILAGGDWPCNANLKRLLTEVPKWLVAARVAKGRRGGESHTWDPALIAVCLRQHESVSISRLTSHIKSDFPDWLDAWNEAKENF